ncbi:MAG: hypothetical protein FJ211_03480 [Ignavibacteria bacterium]|nr:hypothetical protein [Ignavibacteria bacterium]
MSVIQCALVCLICLSAKLSLFSQSAPLINTEKAVAEFISDNARPSFVIKKIAVTGRVDTMKAVVKTSTVRANKGDYTRYKPVVDSIWWTSKDSLNHNVYVLLHLEGQGIPLPANGVRGTVRMTVSAAYWANNDWVATSSEPFSVPVANVDMPRPVISESNLEVAVTKETPKTIAFEIKGLRITAKGKDTVDFLPEVRDLAISDVSVDYEEASLETSNPTFDSLRTVDVQIIKEGGGEYTITGTIQHPTPKAGKKIPKITSAKLLLNVRAKALHRKSKGLSRLRTIEIELYK